MRIRHRGKKEHSQKRLYSLFIVSERLLEKAFMLETELLLNLPRNPVGKIDSWGSVRGFTCHA